MSYKPFNNKKATLGQATTVGKSETALGGLGSLSSTPDGLWLVSASAALNEAELSSGYELNMPRSVIEWLRDIALLRRIPMAYLVPDPSLLPPESIRFFGVDRSWTDRVIDGALWAANLGTLDMTYRIRTLVALRLAVGEALNELVDWDDDDEHDYEYPWDGTDLQAPITGMLIRSELVRRWPDLSVMGYRVTKFTGEQGRPARGDRVRLLRRDLLARDLMIVLFAGRPVRVEVKEPPVGIRFGVEGTFPNFSVNLRVKDGTYPEDAPPVSVATREVGKWLKRDIRTIDPEQLHATLDQRLPGTPGSRGVALNLEQLPYVQVFQGGDEQEGSKLSYFHLLNFEMLRGPAVLRSGAKLPMFEKLGMKIKKDDEP